MESSPQSLRSSMNKSSSCVHRPATNTTGLRCLSRSTATKWCDSARSTLRRLEGVCLQRKVNTHAPCPTLSSVATPTWHATSEKRSTTSRPRVWLQEKIGGAQNTTTHARHD